MFVLWLFMTRRCFGHNNHGLLRSDVWNVDGWTDDCRIDLWILWLRFGFDDSTWSHEWLLIVCTCWCLFGVSCVPWCEKKERNDREITNRWLLCPFFRPLMRDVLCVLWLFAHSIIRWRGGAWAQHELESWFVAIWSDVWNVDGWTDDCRIDLWFLWLRFGWWLGGCVVVVDMVSRMVTYRAYVLMSVRCFLCALVREKRKKR